MRKLLVLLLAALMVFAMVSCDEEVSTKSNEDVGKEKLVQQGAKEGTSVKAIDNKGFKVVGTLEDNAGNLITVEVGGKDGIYWIGLDDDYSDKDAEQSFTYQFFTEIDNGDKTYTIKLFDGEVWNTYTSSKSIKSLLFGENGLANRILYCSFELQDYGFGKATNAGTEEIDGRTCTKYTSSYYVDLSAYGQSSNFKVADAVIYVDSEFFVTMNITIDYTDEFTTLMTTLSMNADDLVKLYYDADVAFDLTSVSLPSGYAAAATAL